LKPKVGLSGCRCALMASKSHVAERSQLSGDVAFGDLAADLNCGAVAL
jgi:hypothetical protein